MQQSRVTRTGAVHIYVLKKFRNVQLEVNWILTPTTIDRIIQIIALTSSRAHPHPDQPTARVCTGLRRRQPYLGQPLPIFQKGMLGFLYKICHLAQLVGSFAPHSEMRSSNPFWGKALPFYFLFCQIRHQPGPWPIRAAMFIAGVRWPLSLATRAQVWPSFYFYF
jgi:hypothetical protein